MKSWPRSPRRARRLVAAALVALAVPLALAGAYDDFFRATLRDDAAAVRELLQRGMDANTRDPNGQTALFIALRDGSFRVADALLADRGLEVDALNASEESALMMAALKGHTEWVQRLLARGARVDKPGWSPLHYAATGPEPAIVRLLLDRGATVDATAPNRTTPLMMAARYGHEDTVELLLKQGADPRARNDRGLTAGDFARLGERAALGARLDALAR